LHYQILIGSITAVSEFWKVLHLKYEIVVELKKEVLDAEGRAICRNLQAASYSELNAVEVSKRFILDLDADIEKANEIAEKFLTNPVSQTCTVRHLDD